MEKNNKKRKSEKLIRNIAKTTGASFEALAGVFLSTPATAYIGVPIAYDGILRLANLISKHQKTDSIITSKIVSDTERSIVQIIPNFKQILELTLIKNKTEVLVYQELKFILNSDRKNEEGEQIKYDTNSHSMTKRLLMKAEKAGLITNFESSEKDPQRIIIEKLLLGNIRDKNLFKKQKFYNMSFEITDKIITKEMIGMFGKSLNVDLLEENKYNIEIDENGRVSDIKLNITKSVKDEFANTKNRLFKGKENKIELLGSGNTEKTNEKGNPNQFKDSLAVDISDQNNEVEKTISEKKEKENKNENEINSNQIEH